MNFKRVLMLFSNNRFINFVICLPCRIEKLWVQNGVTFFFGPIFIHPEETAHEPTKMFYKREVFLSHLEETLPMTCVIGISLTVFKMFFKKNRVHML